MIFNGGEKNKNILKIHLFIILELAARELILESRFVPQLSSLGVKGRGLSDFGARGTRTKNVLSNLTKSIYFLFSTLLK